MNSIAAHLASKNLTVESAAEKAGMTPERFQQVAGGAKATLGEMRGIAKAPVDLRAVKALQQSALALDVYFWTTYRVHDGWRTLPARIAWNSLHKQFGTAYASQSDFAIAFRRALEHTQMVYPELRCSTTDAYLVLHRSSPSVPRRSGR